MQSRLGSQRCAAHWAGAGKAASYFGVLLLGPCAILPGVTSGSTLQGFCGRFAAKPHLKRVLGMRPAWSLVAAHLVQPTDPAGKRFEA